MINFAYTDPGYCRVCFTGSADGTPFCFQEEMTDAFLFYICTGDGEPVHTIPIGLSAYKKIKEDLEEIKEPCSMITRLIAFVEREITNGTNANNFESSS